MIHADRKFTIRRVASLELLADKLARYDWAACQGFMVGQLLLLNDSIGGGHQEYAVFRLNAAFNDDVMEMAHQRGTLGAHPQIDSLTVTRMTAPRILAYLEAMASEPVEARAPRYRIALHHWQPCKECA